MRLYKDMNVMTLNFCHRDFPINYGQTLLGYALYKNVQKLGHNPIAVSYTRRNSEQKKWYLTRYLTPDKKDFFSKSFAMTTEFVRKNMTFVPCFCEEEVYEVAELCDALIVGGDVVWRKGYLGEVFTLDFGSLTKRRVAYAPSIYGWNEDDREFFKREFNKIKRNLDFISFRENASVEEFRQLTGGEVFNAIDPVLLESKEEWTEIAKPMQDISCEFILVYIFGDVNDYKELINRVSTDNPDKRVIIIPTSRDWCEVYDVKDPIGVEEFVWLFINANMIITNSFHGTAFAIEFEKQFFLCRRNNMVGEGTDYRIEELLKKVGIRGNRYYLEDVCSYIDYDYVSKRINAWRNESREYLRMALLETTAQQYPKVYATRNNDFKTRTDSSSGGVFYALATSIIEGGGVVFGVAWDENFEAKHIAVQSIDDIAKLMRSKYVQSYIGDTYKEVKLYLESGRKVLFTGTPCQIYGLRRYLGNSVNSEKLICVSIICHGVPKPEIWREYLDSFYDEYGKAIEVIFREKTDGWKNWNIKIGFEKGEYCSKWDKDEYYKRFLMNESLQDRCFECKAKNHLKTADIIMGDFWRYKSNDSDFDDDMGLSAVVIISEVGNNIWNSVKNQFRTEKSDYKTLSDLQWYLEHSAIKN